MKYITYVIKTIGRVISNPLDVYYHKIIPRLRNHKFPMCHASAIVNRPLKFNPKGVKLEKNVYIFKHGRISCVFEYAGNTYTPSLEIGENTTIQQNVHITCAKSIKIGKSCAITHNVTITDIDHSYEYPVPNSTPPP